MRKVAILASVCASACAFSARADDVTLHSQLSQSVEAHTNYQLQNSSPGMTYTPVSTLVLDGLARTPTMRFSASADLSYRTYFGPGADNLMNTLDKDARLKVEKTTPLTTYTAGTSWSDRAASNVQLVETGFSTASGNIITTSADGGLQHRLTERDTIHLHTTWTSTAFTAAGQTPFTDVLTTGDWTHKISPLTDLISATEFEMLNYDNLSQTETLIARPTIGLKSQLTKRLTFEGAIGAGIVKISQQNPGAAPATSTFTPSPFTPSFVPSFIGSGSGSSAGWLGHAAVTYNVNSVTHLALLASKTVSPDSFGNLLSSETVGGSLRRDINSRAGLTFDGAVSQLTSAGAPSTLFSASVTYDYRLAREWNTALSYRYRQRSDSTGSADSHSIFFVVTRDVTLLP